MAINYKTTKDIKVPKKLINQVIGQENAIKIIKRVAKQRRHLLLIGEPGTGKSMIGQALANLLPNENLQDVITIHNSEEENLPLIKSFPKGMGKDFVFKSRLNSK